MNQETTNKLEEAIRLQKQGRLAEAQRLLHALLVREPKNADALHLLGIVHQMGGNHQQALALFGCAIAIQPRAAEMHYNRGNSLLHLRRFDDAIEAFTRAVRVEPKLFEAQQNLANALMLSGRSAEAAGAFAAALRLSPESPEAHNNLGLALKDQGRLEEAIGSFRAATALRPSYHHAHSNLLYALHFSSRHDASAAFAAHRAWASEHADPLSRDLPPHENDRSPDRRMRIGYVSPDFREHPVGRSMLPILEHFDRAQFEVICYSDGGEADAVTQRLRASATQWHDVRRLPDAALAQLVRRDGIDILVDLTLHMNRNRLLAFARKPAPVQATFLGYPATTGMTQIDYRITDAHLDPPGETEPVNSEQLARLTHSFWCYAPDDDEPEVNELPAAKRGYVTFGSLNNPAKVTQDVIDLWARVLQEVPTSRLLLSVNDPSGAGGWLAEAFAARRIDPARLTFAAKQPRRDYLRRYHDIDIALDPFPYNGHMTSCDALWMGVPVISLRGRTSVGRGGESLLANLQLTELLARSEDEYLALAVSLANDIDRAATLRRTLRQRMRSSPLMDASGFVRDLERLYREMWRRWCG